MHPIHALRAERHAHSRALRALEELTLALGTSRYLEEEDEPYVKKALEKALTILEEKKA